MITTSSLALLTLPILLGVLVSAVLWWGWAVAVNVVTSTYHPITLGNCLGCRIEQNEVRREEGSAKRAVILAGMATRCGNVAPDDRVVDGPCP